MKDMRQINCSDNGLLQHNFGIVNMCMCMYMRTLYIYTFFFMVRQDLLIIEAARSHSDTPQSVGLLWTSDQPFARTST
jgi:hypothetical protein